MTIATILVVILLLMLVFGVASRNGGPDLAWPGGILGTILLILLILALLGRI